jgi:PAS domain S-box-containing protein
VSEERSPGDAKGCDASVTPVDPPGTALRREVQARIAELELALRLAEARFAGVVEISADAIISVDERLDVSFFNEGAERVFGYEASEVVGSPLDILLPERFRAGHGALVRGFGAGEGQARRMGHRREISALRKNGEEFPAEASISKLRVGEVLTYNVVLRDVSERKRAEDRQRFLSEATGLLSATSLDYGTTMATLTRLTVPTLADCCTVDVSDGATGLTRIAVAHANPAKEELLRESARYPVQPTDRHTILRVLGDGVPTLIPDITPAMLDTAAIDGAHRAMLQALGPRSMISVPLLASGRVIGALTVIMAESGRRYGPDDLALVLDLARRAALAVENARLFHDAQRATRARDDMLGIVAHDLRNPLSTILMGSEMLLDGVGSPDEARSREIHQMIERAATSMQRLIEDLLDVQRAESAGLSLDRRSEPVAQLVANAVVVLRPLAVGASLTLESLVPADLPAVYADPARIQQVLSNLVGNAIKFTPKGGHIAIAARLESATEVRISVRDTGSGIPPDQLPCIFGLFWQGRRSDRRGVGLGLAIVTEIVEAHDGRVWAESQVNVGSEFIFTLPVAHD